MSKDVHDTWKYLYSHKIMCYCENTASCATVQILLEGNGCLVFFNLLVLSVILGLFLHRPKTRHLSQACAPGAQSTFQTCAAAA